MSIYQYPLASEHVLMRYPNERLRARNDNLRQISPLELDILAKGFPVEMGWQMLWENFALNGGDPRTEEVLGILQKLERGKPYPERDEHLRIAALVYDALKDLLD